MAVTEGRLLLLGFDDVRHRVLYGTMPHPMGTDEVYLATVSQPTAFDMMLDLVRKEIR
jgi:hypothetical protein